MRLTPIIASFALIALCGGGYATYERSKLALATPFDDITVGRDGAIRQSGKTVAYFDAAGQATIPLITPDSTGASSIGLRVLSDGISEDASLAAKVLSIQSVSDVYAAKQGSDIIVFGGPFVPDSYTSLRLTAEPSYFSPPLDKTIVNWLSELPFSTGTFLGLALLIVSAGWLRYKMPGASWRGNKPLGIPPAGIGPLELAILHHGSIQARDLTALLIDLAERGFVQVISRDGHLLFAKTTLESDLTSHERGFLSILFPQNEQLSHLDNVISTLNKDLFSAATNQLYVSAYGNLERAGYFSSDPRNVHLAHKTWAIATQITGLIGVVLASFIIRERFAWIMPLSFSVYGSGWLWFRSAGFVSLFSEAGRNVVAEASRLTSYLSLKEPIGLEGNQAILFYQYIPYALASDTLEAWLARFGSNSFYVPDWYSNDDSELYTPVAFVSDLFATSAILAKTISGSKDPNVD